MGGERRWEGVNRVGGGEKRWVEVSGYLGGGRVVVTCNGSTIAIDGRVGCCCVVEVTPLTPSNDALTGPPPPPPPPAVDEALNPPPASPFPPPTSPALPLPSNECGGRGGGTLAKILPSPISPSPVVKSQDID